MADPNYSAIVMLIEENWGEFVAWCEDSEEDAKNTLQHMKKEAGMS